jgi:hypothetical protein
MKNQKNQERTKLAEMNLDNSEYFSEISLEESNIIVGGKLKCINIPNSRFQLCGDTDFKTKGLVGGGVRF